MEGDSSYEMVREVSRMGTLDGFVQLGERPGIDLRWLETGAVVDVETLHSRYRLVVVEAPQRLVRVQGGRSFNDETTARIDGSSAGGSLLALGRIVPGFCLELSVSGHRTVTSPIRSVSCLDPESGATATTAAA